MITESKVIELFCMADDFCKFFDAMMTKYTLKTTVKRTYHRVSTLSKAGIMLIMILFHDSGYRCLKHFYQKKSGKHMRHLFPMVVSYNRFVELEKKWPSHRHISLKRFLWVNTLWVGFSGLNYISYATNAENSLNFMITPGDADDRKPLEYKVFVEFIYGKLVGDKGYIGKKLFGRLFVDGIQLITKLKKQYERSTDATFKQTTPQETGHYRNRQWRTQKYSTSGTFKAWNL